METVDIESVVQWRNLMTCVLHQRYGRGAYDKTLNAVAVLFVERMLVVDPERESKANRWGEKGERYLE